MGGYEELKKEEVMKPNELRIGNLVYDSTMNTTVVESIIPEHGRVRHPIPLTEERLIRFWFVVVRENKDSGYKELVLIKNGFHFLFCIECNGSPEFYLEGVGLDLEYVHQLQNLYFALTGEELTITK